MGRGPAESGAAGVTFQTSDFDTGVSFWHLASFRCDAEFGPLSVSQRTWLDLPLGRPCSE